MPFQSQAQARYMFSQHPKMAAEMASKTDSIKALPQHVKPAAEKPAGAPTPERSKMAMQNMVSKYGKQG